MLETDQITYCTPHVRIVYWVAIYKYNVINSLWGIAFDYLNNLLKNICLDICNYNASVCFYEAVFAF